MNRIQITPAEYHSNLQFNPKALPDLEAAGPVSASVICAARDPLSFLFGEPKKNSKAMKWGNLLDTLWLTPELFDQIYIVLPADAPQKPTKAMLEAKKPGAESIERQEWWRQWEMRSAGKTAVKAETMREVQSAVSMLHQHKLATYIRESSEIQVALLGNNPYGWPGQTKCLIDLRPVDGPFKGSVGDLKSTNDVTERALKLTTWSFQYHVKMPFYGDMLEAAFGEPIDRYFLIWQRSKFPYDVHVRYMDPADIEAGRRIILKRFKEMQQMNPMDISNLFDEDISTLSLEQWQRDSEPGLIEDTEEAASE